MTKRDVEAMEHAKAIMEYCKNHKNCKDCVFMVYGGEHDCCGVACQECWNEAYITDRTEERSK